MTTLDNHRKNTTLRFLGYPNPTPNNPPSSNSFEFQESDLIFSSQDNTTIDTISVSNSPPTPTPTPTPNHIPRQPHHGLSAALSNDHHRLLRRKSALNPSVSAAKTIPHRSEGISGVKFHQSAPMNVPVWPKKEMRSKNFDEIEEEEDEMVPPHEIVARSHVTFSVFEGVGRTLKGRDLRRVRNAVFQQTANLDCSNIYFNHHHDTNFQSLAGIKIYTENLAPYSEISPTGFDTESAGLTAEARVRPEFSAAY